jgi:hypothetical protein
MPNTALHALLEAFAIAASPEYAREYFSRSTSGAKTAFAEAGENRFPDGSESRARVFATNRKNSRRKSSESCGSPGSNTWVGRCLAI